MTGWNMYGSYWKWWIFWPVMLVFRGASLRIKNGNFPTCHFLLYWTAYLHDQSVEMRDRKLGERFMWAVTSWGPSVFVVYPVVGFKYFLCSPLPLGKWWSNLTSIFCQMGRNHQLDIDDYATQLYRNYSGICWTFLMFFFNQNEGKTMPSLILIYPLKNKAFLRAD